MQGDDRDDSFEDAENILFRESAPHIMCSGALEQATMNMLLKKKAEGIASP